MANKIVGDIVKFYLNNVKTGLGFDNVMKQVTVTHAADGKCIAEFKLLPEHCNHMGGLHGGFSSTLVDCLSSVALMTQEDCLHVSVNLNLQFYKAAKIGEDVVVDSKVIKHGKTLAFLNTVIKNKAGDLLVNGDHTKYILRK